MTRTAQELDSRPPTTASKARPFGAGQNSGDAAPGPSSRKSCAMVI
jgi:hypothetical protein